MQTHAPCSPFESSSGEAGDIAAKAKILVVEDDENILNLLSAYLESAGHDVVVHQDGQMGYKAALTDTFRHLYLRCHAAAQIRYGDR